MEEWAAGRPHAVMREVLPAIVAPTLVLHARRDRMHPLEQGRMLAAGIPRAELVVLDTDNHVLCEHEPAWAHAKDELRRFLRAHDGARACRGGCNGRRAWARSRASTTTTMAMASFDILIAPHPALKTPTLEVAAVGDDVRALLDDMLATMYVAPGIGLAAPQVGRSERVCVVDVAGKDEPRNPMFLVNPKILQVSAEREVAEEGCLSLPEIYADVERPAAVKVGYLDRDGEPREIEADGLLARCLQHEIDHLDGVLFVDHLSMLKRRMLMRKLAKLRRAKQRDG